MIVYICTTKFKNYRGEIVDYMLATKTNCACRIAPNQLKAMIEYNDAKVLNLKLTSDGRLIEIHNNKIPKIKVVDIPRAEVRVKTNRTPEIKLIARVLSKLEHYINKVKDNGVQSNKVRVTTDIMFNRSNLDILLDKVNKTIYLLREVRSAFNSNTVIGQTKIVSKETYVEFNARVLERLLLTIGITPATINEEAVNEIIVINGGKPITDVNIINNLDIQKLFVKDMYDCVIYDYAYIDELVRDEFSKHGGWTRDTSYEPGEYVTYEPSEHEVKELTKDVLRSIIDNKSAFKSVDDCVEKIVILYLEELVQEEYEKQNRIRE